MKACKNICPTFRMCGVLQFSRPIVKENDTISLGGYTFIMNGREIAFDFESFYGSVCIENPYTLEFECRNPDYSTYPILEEITQDDLHNISAIKEFSVYVGEKESGLEPIAINSLSIVLPYNESTKPLARWYRSWKFSV